MCMTTGLRFKLLLSNTACQLPPGGPVRLAAASTQHDTKQMRNGAQMIMSPGNICEGVECLQEGEL